MSADDNEFDRFRSLFPKTMAITNPVRSVQRFMETHGLTVTTETNMKESGEYESICKVTHDGGKYECAVSGFGKTARFAKEKANGAMLDYLTVDDHKELRVLFNSIQV